MKKIIEFIKEAYNVDKFYTVFAIFLTIVFIVDVFSFHVMMIFDLGLIYICVNELRYTALRKYLEEILEKQ